MPTTLTVNDPQSRTNSVFLDLSDPMCYKIVITREIVRVIAETGEVYSREMGTKIVETINFDLDGNPSGDPIILPLLKPIKDAIYELVAKYDVK